MITIYDPRRDRHLFFFLFAKGRKMDSSGMRAGRIRGRRLIFGDGARWRHGFILKSHGGATGGAFAGAKMERPPKPLGCGTFLISYIPAATCHKFKLKK